MPTPDDLTAILESASEMRAAADVLAQRGYDPMQMLAMATERMQPSQRAQVVAANRFIATALADLAAELPDAPVSPGSSAELEGEPTGAREE